MVPHHGISQVSKVARLSRYLHVCQELFKCFVLLLQAGPENIPFVRFIMLRRAVLLEFFSDGVVVLLFCWGELKCVVHINGPLARDVQECSNFFRTSLAVPALRFEVELDALLELLPILAALSKRSSWSGSGSTSILALPR